MPRSSSRQSDRLVIALTCENVPSRHRCHWPGALTCDDMNVPGDTRSATEGSPWDEARAHRAHVRQMRQAPRPPSPVPGDETRPGPAPVQVPLHLRHLRPTDGQPVHAYLHRPVGLGQAPPSPGACREGQAAQGTPQADAGRGCQTPQGSGESTPRQDRRRTEEPQAACLAAQPKHVHGRGVHPVRLPQIPSRIRRRSRVGVRGG